jgi:hypothetical protein
VNIQDMQDIFYIILNREGYRFIHYQRMIFHFDQNPNAPNNKELGSFTR